MRLVRRRELEGGDLEAQIRRRVRDIEDELQRLQNERTALEVRAAKMATARKVRKEKATAAAVRRKHPSVVCPRCGRDRDFLTDADGYLAHVLEEPGDTELLTDGKPLFCPACGEVFLYAAPDGPE
jgi:ribosomal protein S27AE